MSQESEGLVSILKMGSLPPPPICSVSLSEIHAILCGLPLILTLCIQC